MLKIYTDGGSRGNPGKSAGAFVVIKNGNKIKELARFFGTKTNNEAEYNAIILALTIVKAKQFEIISDSELVIKQINQEYKTTEPHLKELRQKVEDLIKSRKIKFSNTARDDKFISRADYLVNKELDKH